MEAAPLLAPLSDLAASTNPQASAGPDRRMETECIS